MHDDAGVLRHIEHFRARAMRTGEGRLKLQVDLSQANIIAGCSMTCLNSAKSSAPSAPSTAR